MQIFVGPNARQGYTCSILLIGLFALLFSGCAHSVKGSGAGNMLARSLQLKKSTQKMYQTIQARQKAIDVSKQPSVYQCLKQKLLVARVALDAVVAGHRNLQEAITIQAQARANRLLNEIERSEANARSAEGESRYCQSDIPDS